MQGPSTANTHTFSRVCLPALHTRTQSLHPCSGAGVSDCMRSLVLVRELRLPGDRVGCNTRRGDGVGVDGAEAMLSTDPVCSSRLV
ncbi:Hypothetical protein NTJ_02892 [Nesidiocoris tenuis]|uniref:Uncharacterized protein n=1 Tax=Nesidiocoris tenuis TaxID=355587 RepID=A0ABN7ACT0_9HEMI|nr:Hypothetical protein NTJ_02892 [Nesidiocoris tenuis]